MIELGGDLRALSQAPRTDQAQSCSAHPAPPPRWTRLAPADKMPLRHAGDAGRDARGSHKMTAGRWGWAHMANPPAAERSLYHSAPYSPSARGTAAAAGTPASLHIHPEDTCASCSKLLSRSLSPSLTDKKVLRHLRAAVHQITVLLFPADPFAAPSSFWLTAQRQMTA